MIRTLFIAVFLMLFHQLVFAQNITQTIRGTVIDEDTQLPLIGATVAIVGQETSLGAVTEIDGTFRLPHVPIGRVDLLISYLGYEDKIIPNVEVNSAKEVVLDVQLVEASLGIEEVVVTATEKKGAALNDLAIVGTRSVSAEQTSRYAGGFNDPSKITSNCWCGYLPGWW